MKTQTNKRVIVQVMLLLLYLQTQGQSLQSNYGAPSSPLQVANGAATFKIRINGGVTACQGPSNLNIVLPAGYVYVSGSATVTAGNGAVVQTSASNNTAILAVSNIPATPDSTIISYQAYAGCGAIGGSGTGISYSLSGCSGTASATATVNTQNAQLNITGVTNSAFVGTNGQTYSRVITVTNNGNGAIDTIHLDSKNSGLTITGTAASSGVMTMSKTWVGTDTTYHYRVTGPTANGHLENSETLVFTETVKISNCNGGTTELKTWYGPAGTECTVVSNIFLAGATVSGSLQPNVVASLISQPELKCLPTTAATDWVVFQLKNTGSGIANISSLRNYSANSASHATAGPVSASGNFGAGGNTCASRTMYVDTAAGIQYSTNGGSNWNNLSYSVFQWYAAWPAGGGYHDGKPMSISFDGLNQLAAGDSVQIRFKVFEEIPPCCIGTWITNSYSINAAYTDACGNNATASNNVVTGATVSQQYGQMANASALDAVAGQPYLLQFKGFIINPPSNQLRTSNDGYIDYELTLPTSLTPSLIATDHAITKGATVKVPDNVSWDPVTRKLRLRFLRSTLSSNDFDPWTLTVKTNPDCSGTGNTVALNAYVKLAACASTEWLATCNSEATFTLHNCGITSSCVGALNYQTMAYRSNYGMFSSGNNGLPLGTSDTSMYNLAGTVYGDTIAIITTSKINGVSSYSNMHTSITKSAPDAAHVFVDAVARVYNSAGTLTATVTAIGAGTTSGTNPSTRTISITGTGAPAAFLPGDSVVVITRFRQLLDEDARVNFSTTTYTSNSASSSATPQFSCDGNWTGTLYSYGHGVTSGSFTTGTINSCNGVPVTMTGLNFLINPSSPAQARHSRFPYEIRELYRFDSLKVAAPAGFDITNLKISIAGQGTTASNGIASLPVAAYDATTNTYYYSLTSLTDQLIATGVPFSEGLQLYVQPSFKSRCKNGNFSNLVATASVHYSYLPQSNWAWATTGCYLQSVNNFFVPLNISSSSPNQTVNSNTVSWEVQISNVTAVAKPNAWLAKAVGVNGTTITSIQSLSGPGGTTTGTIVPVSGIYQLGSIAASTSQYYRITATFTNCVQDSLKMIGDFSCDAYPADVTTALASCRLQTLPLTVTAQTATLQLAKITEPSGIVNLCDNLNYELEVTNSGLGNASGLSVRVQLPFTGGIQYVTGTYGIKYPSTAGSYTSLADINVAVAGNLLTFTIPASALASLPGTEKFRIQFQMKTLPCDFTSGEKLIFRPVGKNNCSTTIFGTSVASNPINIAGVPPIVPQFTISATANSVTACGSGPVSTTYKFKMVNTGSNTTTLADGFRITLPAPWTMNTTVAFSHNPSSASYANSPVSGVYDFKTGAGLTVGDSIVFTTTLNTASAMLLACGPDSIIASGFVEFASFCASPATTCNTKQLLEPEQVTTLLVSRPEYSITAFTGLASGNPPNHLTGSFTLSNAGIFVPQNGTLRVYQDVNSNGMQDAADSLLGSQSYTLANLATQTFSYDITASGNPGNICPVVAVVELACNCDTPSFSYSCNSIVLPIHFSRQEGKAEGCTVKLNWAYEASNTIVTGFVIERSSNGSRWYSLAQLPEHTQTYTDVVPDAGLWLYRVKAINTENELAYGKTISVKTDCKNNAIRIFPNPAKGYVNISLIGYKNLKTPYSITDKLGRTLQQGILKSDTQNTVSLDSFAPGIYFIHVADEDNVYIEKIEILR